MSSNITIPAEVTNAFDHLKSPKGKKDFAAFTIEMIKKNTELKVSETIPGCEDDDSVIQKLLSLYNDQTAGFFVIDVSYRVHESTGNAPKNTLVLGLFSGEHSPLKQKMVAASSFTKLKNALNADKFVEVHEVDELVGHLCEICQKKASGDIIELFGRPVEKFQGEYRFKSC